MVAPTGTAYSIPGKWKSEVYCARPVTFRGPSNRTVSRPIGEAVGEACVCIAIVVSPSAGSAVRHRMQSVHKTALRQFNLEFVFALRFGIAQCSFGSLVEICGIRGLAGERRFRFGRAPWFRSNSA